jgi:glyoxylase-like metal-dependent hydrolase (beta-lactamase superfamily II)
VALNDAVHWSADLGAGVRVALVQAGAFRSDAGALFGPVPRVLWGTLVADEIDAEGRVLVETGIGERLDERGRTWRALQGEPIVPTLLRAGFDPASVDIVAMSHLHYDHAGGLLRADGTRAFPRARIVAQRAEWEIALDANPRIVASYDQPELHLVHAWGDAGAADGEVELLPGVWAVPTGGHTAGHQAIVVRAPGRTLAFLGDIAMRRWSANPRWTLFARAAEESWTVVLSHERERPVGRLVPDRDRFAWEPLV